MKTTAILWWYERYGLNVKIYIRFENVRWDSSRFIAFQVLSEQCCSRFVMYWLICHRSLYEGKETHLNMYILCAFFVIAFSVLVSFFSQYAKNAFKSLWYVSGSSYFEGIFTLGTIIVSWRCAEVNIQVLNAETKSYLHCDNTDTLIFSIAFQIQYRCF